MGQSGYRNLCFRNHWTILCLALRRPFFFLQTTPHSAFRLRDLFQGSEHTNWGSYPLGPIANSELVLKTPLTVVGYSRSIELGELCCCKFVDVCTKENWKDTNNGEGCVTPCLFSSQVQRGSIAPPAEEKAHGSISTMTYVRFFRAGGHYFVLFCVLVSFIVGEVCIYWADVTVCLKSAYSIFRLVLSSLIGGYLTGKFLEQHS